MNIKMEMERMTHFQNRCKCEACAQGRLTKEQYANEMRAICNRMKQTSRLNPVRRDVCLRKSTDSYILTPSNKKAMNKTDSPTVNQSGNYYNEWKIHQWQEEVIENRKMITNTRSCYYLDEEQPCEIGAFSEMVNERASDPRILPAVVDTIKFLRQRYHQMLLEMKPKSKDFFEREFAKLDRNRFYAKRHRSKHGSLDSWDGSESGTTTDSHDSLDYAKSNRYDLNTNNNNEAVFGGSIRDSIHICSQRMFDRFPPQLSPSHDVLHSAALNGDTERVMLLTLKGYDVNQLNQDGWSPVAMALQMCKFRCAIFLIEAGTDMEVFTGKRKKEYRDVIHKARRYLQIVRTSL